MKARLDEGSVLLETVFAMPIIFVLVMGVLQIAHIWMARQVVKYAAYCAARSTLTSNAVSAHGHAYEAARQVCAWITFSEKAEESQDVVEDEVEIPGWGKIPHSGSVDRRLRVEAGLFSAYNLLSPWETRATVEFDFPLLMPIAGRMLSFLPTVSSDELQKGLSDGSIDYAVVRGWTGQQNVLASEEDEANASPYITIRETCILPKPYSTGVYPCTSADYDIELSGLLR